jgi:hypothetical protein
MRDVRIVEWGTAVFPKRERVYDARDQAAIHGRGGCALGSGVAGGLWRNGSDEYSSSFIGSCFGGAVKCGRQRGTERGGECVRRSFCGSCRRDAAWRCYSGDASDQRYPWRGESDAAGIPGDGGDAALEYECQADLL